LAVGVIAVLQAMVALGVQKRRSLVRHLGCQAGREARMGGRRAGVFLEANKQHFKGSWISGPGSPLILDWGRRFKLRLTILRFHGCDTDAAGDCPPISAPPLPSTSSLANAAMPSLGSLGPRARSAAEGRMSRPTFANKRQPIPRMSFARQTKDDV
jgi:hypothetical protein